MIGDQKTDMEFAKRAKIKGYLFNKKNLYKFIEDEIFLKKKFNIIKFRNNYRKFI